MTSPSVKAEWLVLTIEELNYGAFVGYEALTDKRMEGDWEEVRRWVEHLLDDIVKELNVPA